MNAQDDAGMKFQDRWTYRKKQIQISEIQNESLQGEIKEVNKKELSSFTTLTRRYK
jgi:hypothetical protein